MACKFASLAWWKRPQHPGGSATPPSGDYLQTVMNTVLDGLITIDSHGIIQTFNLSATKIFGYEPEEVVGRNVRVLMPDPYQTEHDQYIAQYIKTGKKKVIGIGREVFGRRKDGSVFPMDLGVNDMWIDGKLMFVGTVRDISERKQSEEERQKFVQQLTQSNTELERFAYVASHDMQEPIRMITNFSQIIAGDYAKHLDDAGKEYLDIVVNSGTRMKEMIDDLLEYSRVGCGSIAARSFPGDTIFDGVMNNLKAFIDEKGAIVTADHLPELQGNPVQIMRLLQNLVVNGIKYQPEGNRPYIHIGVRRENAEWVISVSDNGLGIEQDFIKQIFQPFRRLHTWSDIKGTGLGLAICKKIVDLHHGRIWVTSTPGQGSTFHFTLPIKEAEGVEEERPAKRA